MKIGIDLDSVLNDLEIAWSAWIRDVSSDPFWSPEKWVTWDIHTIIPMGERVFDFLRLRGAFLDLNPRPLGQETTRALLDAGHELFVVTTNVYAENGPEKSAWLSRHFPHINWKNVIASSHKGMLKLDVLIDDAPHNFDGFGGRCLLFDQPWNRSPKELARAGDPLKLRRVIDWHEVGSVLL